MKIKSFIMKNEFFFLCINFEGLLPSLYCERKRKKKFCIAIQFCIAENEACRCLGCIAIGWRLYCKKGCWRAVLQYSVLYCNRLQG